MSSPATTNNDKIAKEYETKTYDELSKEYQSLFSKAKRAFELIPLMYNRLTIMDKLTHKQAVKKMRTDHKDLSGFTDRNIRRYLPPDNPHVQRRNRTPRPKGSKGGKDKDEQGGANGGNDSTEKNAPRPNDLRNAQETIDAQKGEILQLTDKCEKLGEAVQKISFSKTVIMSPSGEVKLTEKFLVPMIVEHENKGARDFYLKHDGRLVTAVESDIQRQL